MPTIKIVPMPGASVPGPQGPQGIPGPAGADADLGYLTITSETDPEEGPLTTLEAPGSITIQSPTAPGLVTIQSYLGLDVIAHPDNGGIYINGRDPENKVVTFADLSSATAFPSPVSWTPVVSGAGFTQTSNPATGTYLKYGTMVVVNLFVPFSNVTSFGTGQYSVTLPFTAKQHADVFAGSIHNVGPTVDHYSLKGHLSTGSQSMTLWYISGSSKDEPFKSNAPINLNTTDLFHMHFIYEIQE